MNKTTKYFSVINFRIKLFGCDIQVRKKHRDLNTAIYNQNKMVYKDMLLCELF